MLIKYYFILQFYFLFFKILAIVKGVRFFVLNPVYSFDRHPFKHEEIRHHTKEEIRVFLFDPHTILLSSTFIRMKDR